MPKLKWSSISKELHALTMIIYSIQVESLLIKSKGVENTTQTLKTGLKQDALMVRWNEVFFESRCRMKYGKLRNPLDWSSEPFIERKLTWVYNVYLLLHYILFSWPITKQRSIHSPISPLYAHSWPHQTNNFMRAACAPPIESHLFSLHLYSEPLKNFINCVSNYIYRVYPCNYTHLLHKSFCV